LEGDARHLIAVFQREKPRAPQEAFEFRVLENRAGVTRTIFRRGEFFFTLPKNDTARLNATDINGDSAREIVVQSSSGGNCWSCNPTEVYRIAGGKADLIAAGPIQKIVDLDGDQIAELLITDARWEVYDDLSHAAAPSAMMIYAWRGGRYVYASREFQPWYEAETRRLQASIEAARASITGDDFSDDSYVGHAMSLAITLAHAGEPERATRELATLLTSNTRSPAQLKRRRMIIDDFARGESATKLRQMKPGDPMQLQ
jgi:hypothetical protein